MAPPLVRPTVGSFAIWGSSDLPGFGDQLLPRIIEQQLVARLPGWSARLFAPLGWTRPSVCDGGVVAAPLVGHLTGAPRVSDVAHASVVCPTFPVGIAPDALAEIYGCARAAEAAPWFHTGLGADPEVRHPVVWAGVRVGREVPAEMVTSASRQPYLAVRDTVSRDRLRAAGVEAPISVIGHPGLLVAGLVPDDALCIRRAHLRQLGLLPADGAFVVVQVTEPVAAELPGWTRVLADVLAEVDAEHVVLMPTVSTTQEPAGGHLLPADLVLEDRLAVLAGARAVVAADEHVAVACAGLQVRWALIDLVSDADPQRAAALEFGYAKQITDQPGKLRAAVAATATLPVRKGRVMATLADHFDRLAAVAESAFAAHGGDLSGRSAELAAENDALRAVNARARQRALTERQRLVEPLVEALRARDAAEAELARVQASHGLLAARLAQCEQEVRAWQNTKLARWSRPVRDVYGKLRGS